MIKHTIIGIPLLSPSRISPVPPPCPFLPPKAIEWGFGGERSIGSRNMILERNNFFKIPFTALISFFLNLLVLAISCCCCWWWWCLDFIAVLRPSSKKPFSWAFLDFSRIHWFPFSINSRLNNRVVFLPDFTCSQDLGDFFECLVFSLRHKEEDEDDSNS